MGSSYLPFIVFLGLSAKRITIGVIELSSFLPKKQFDESKLRAAMGCMREGRFSQAYLLLKEMQTVERADILFSLGLCCYRVEDYSSAAGYFEKTLSIVKRQAAHATTFPKDETYIRLRKQELSSFIFLLPLYQEYLEAFPFVAKENVILASAAAYMKCNDAGKVEILLNSLSATEFDEIKAEISRL